MDAIVFFVASMIVSGVLFSLVSTGTDGQDAVSAIEGFDADKALTAFLRTSLGTEVEMVLGGGVLTLSERDEVAECILLEAHCIAEGDAESTFEILNGVLDVILESISRPFMVPFLQVLDVSDDDPAVLVSIPSEWEEVGEAFAASSLLTDAEGRTYLIQFRSVPASSAEL